jgi:dTDP-4-amino-4,6-dideoxygalactose transaminase
MPTPIPFLDLKLLQKELKSDLLAVLEQAIDTAGFIGGPMVNRFEEEFAHFCTTRYCVAVNSGTDALRFAYIAGGIKPGDEVITVPNTFIATAESISQAGAHVVFVDIDERTSTMDPAKLLAFLESDCIRESDTGRTRNRLTGRPVTGLVPVHLYGQPADMDALLDIAGEWNLIVFEDACQAHGAAYYSRKSGEWRTAGSMGKASAFSFYPGKNLGALGEGGAITTDDPGIADRCRMLRDHGQARKYYHEIEGYNGRLDAIQCGFLSLKLKKLPEWNDARRRHAATYTRLLSPLGSVVVPFEPAWARGVYHLYVIRVENRDALQQGLAERGIATALHYPVPLHLQKPYAAQWKHGAGFPVAERCARELLSLPLFPGLTEKQVRFVAEAIKDAVETAPPEKGQGYPA